ncbi:MAG: phosphatidate cytidylyltransferase [Clostridium sp.]|nr:phosphatidate cytidylyltransferase [Clostridium sp.]MCM1547121.1 phosphatidate cytidylyltransferase [Ruminococcus sp.]
MGIRLLSAGIGIIIALVVLLLHNTIVLNIAAAALIVLILYELFKAGGCVNAKLTCIPAYIYGAVMPFIVTGSAAKYKFAVNVVFLFVIFMTFIIQHNSLEYQKSFFILACTLLVSNSMSCLVALNEMDKVHGLMYLVLGLCGAWLADSGAYFAGTFFGKHKLCPEVSPKKTVEGFIGGIVVTGGLFVLINFGYSKILPQITEYTADVNYIMVFIIGAVLAVVGTIGDLSASVLKRQCGIKDYGNIMPGHGGAMDRFDSVIFVVPCFYAFVSLVNIYK